MPTIIHLVYVDPVQNSWRVSGEHPGEIFGLFSHKESAIAAAREIAEIEHGQMIVRGLNEAIEIAEDYASVEG